MSCKRKSERGYCRIRPVARAIGKVTGIICNILYYSCQHQFFARVSCHKEQNFECKQEGITKRFYTNNVINFMVNEKIWRSFEVFGMCFLVYFLFIQEDIMNVLVLHVVLKC